MKAVGADPVAQHVSTSDTASAVRSPLTETSVLKNTAFSSAYTVIAMSKSGMLNLKVDMFSLT